MNMKRYCIACIKAYDYESSLYCEQCQWLKKQFEYDYCAECNGDETNHTIETVLGNPFARCKQILPFDSSDFETFLHQYVDTALWSSTNETDPETGAGNSFQSDNFDIEDLSICCLEQMKHDCLNFMTSTWDMIKDDPSTAGHDFWLTRNGHGAGFWDGDWPDDIGDKLTSESKPYGSAYLYLGDDGKIYSHS
jgi:hypothetical protein